MKKRISITLEDWLVELLMAAAKGDHQMFSNEIEKTLIEKYGKSDSTGYQLEVNSPALQAYMETFEDNKEVYRRLANS